MTYNDGSRFLVRKETYIYLLISELTQKRSATVGKFRPRGQRIRRDYFLFHP